MSPAGDRLAVTVSTLNHDATKYVTALWEVDPDGNTPARRLTRGLAGESAPEFTAAGDLLFLATRPTEDGAEAEEAPSLWMLPAAGGEACRLASRPGGFDAVHAARSASRLLISAEALPSATSEEHEAELRKVRKDAKVSAILHSSYPVRYWDHDLSPAAPRLFDTELPAAPSAGAATPSDRGPAATTTPALRLRALTPSPGKALVAGEANLSADGSFAVTTWSVPGPGAIERSTLVRIDTETGRRTVIADSQDAEYAGAHISPDGSLVAYLRESITSPEAAPEVTLWVSNADGSQPRRVAADWDRWPGEMAWLPDGSGLLVIADDGGRAPVFHVTLGGQVTRLTADDAAYSAVAVAPQGDRAYALRASYAHPAEVVRLDLDGPHTTVTALP